MTEETLAREKTNFYLPRYAGVPRKIWLKETVRIWDLRIILIGEVGGEKGTYGKTKDFGDR